MDWQGWDTIISRLLTFLLVIGIVIGALVVGAVWFISSLF